MKKLINGHTISLNIDFWLDYLYGKELHKITLSNIYSNVSNINKKTIDTINKYAQIYSKLHPIIQTVENNIKYGLIGELMKMNYKVFNKSLYIEDKGFNLCFRGENWSIKKEVLSDSDPNVYKFKDFSNNLNFQIYNDYLKNGPQNFIKNNFKELWSAINEDEKKLYIELDSILTFMDCKEYKIDNNCIVDIDKNIKYTFLPVYKEVKTKTSKMIIDLDDNSPQVSTINKEDTYTYSIFKQNIIETSAGKTGYGEEIKENNIFIDILSNLRSSNKKNIKGIILGNTIYYEIDNIIWQSKNGKSEKIIQNGSIYGNNMDDLLISYSKPMEENIYKNIIYLSKNNSLDPIKYTFERTKL